MTHQSGLRGSLVNGLLPALAVLTLLLAACGGGGGGAVPPAASERIITATVTSTAGGTFSDNDLQPTFTITIPPGALISDSELTVDRLLAPPAVGANQTAAGDAFQINLETGTGGAPRVFADFKIEMRAAPVPAHPQLGEIAQLDGGQWVNLTGDFFRASDSTVVTLTRLTSAVFRVVLRDRQLAVGPEVAAGREVFLNQTFGNENFFGPVIGLHTLLNAAPPSAVVPLGVQVDLNKVPQAIVDVMIGTDLAAKDAALNDPVTTQQLIKAGAVIGVKGVYANPGDIIMSSAGITCALCHVNVTPTTFTLLDTDTGLPVDVALPIGEPQFDGVPNTRMDAGAILALTPFGQDPDPINVAIAADLNSWGPGRFDVRALPDNPLDDGVNNPTSNPPLWNFIDLQEQGYLLGWDGLFEDDGVTNNALASQAEAVYDLVMHANGAFGTATGNLPPELSIVPPAALLTALQDAETAQPGNVILTQELLNVQAWMRSLPSPAPGAFDEAVAQQGFELFYGKAGCVLCHNQPDIWGPGTFNTITATPPAGDLANGIHIPSLRGIAHTAPYFHDQSAAALADVVAQFVANGQVPATLTAAEQAALVEYLNSL
jgi:hypothetical protein